MDPERREEVRRLFLEAIELPPDERSRLLERAAPEPAVRAEVLSLLRYHDTRTLIAAARPSGGGAARDGGPAPRAGRLARAIALLRTAAANRAAQLAVLGASALLVALWIAIEAVAREQVETLLGEQLRTVRDTDVAALEAWIHGEQDRALLRSRSPGVREAILALARAAADGAGGDDLRAHPAQLDLRRALVDLDGDRYLAYGAAARGGLILVSRRLASTADELAGRRLSEQALQRLARVWRGEALFAPPRWLLSNVQDREPEGELTVSVVAPVEDDDGEVVAALGFSVRPGPDFNRILEVGRVASTGETYAFDQDGVMLSESRFPDSVRALAALGALRPAPPSSAAAAGAEGTWGAAPAPADVRSAARLVLRDPGVDLTRGEVPREPPEEWPPTLAVRRALAAASTPGGGRGVEVSEPYRDYRGCRSVGAWAWLDEHGFGVVTELEVREAYGLLARLDRVLHGVFVLLVAAVLGVLALGVSRARLARRLRVYGQYTLLDCIGRGGMGEVWRARHALLRRPTAVKIIGDAWPSDEARERFEREVQTAAELSHPNTVEIYDYGRTEGGEVFYAMELLDGPSLAAVLEHDGAQPPARVVHVLRQVCGALGEAHACGILHRDVKPANVILCRRGGLDDFVKVLDFGLVQREDCKDLTRVDAVSGTPPYIAPERLRGMVADARADLFSVGVMAYRLLGGADPWEGRTPLEVCAKVLHDEPRDLATLAAHVPERLVRLVHELLARDPDGRPPDTAAVEVRLRELAAALPWTAADARAWWTAHAAWARAGA